MMVFSRTHTFVTAAVLGLLAAQGAAAASVEAQRQAIFACKSQAGIGGETSLSTSIGAEAKVTILPFDEVAPEDAAAINACAAQLLSGGAVSASAGSKSARPQGRYSQPGRYSRGGYTVNANPVIRSPLCPKHFYGLYRGSLYCFDLG
jgi:hypothetical protein